MADVTERLARAQSHVAPDWTPERERAVRAGIGHRLEQQRRRRVVAVAAATMLLVVSAIVVVARTLGARPHVVAAGAGIAAAPAALLELADGSTVTRASLDARVEPVEVGPDAVSVRLTSGAARFSVTPNPSRAFRVTAGDVTVTVLGTIFTVAREPGGVRVSVERGRVHVGWPAGERTLSVGEQVLVATLPAPAAALDRAADTEAVVAPSATDGVAVAPSSERAARTTPAPSAGPSWRALAQDGDYAAAFARLSRAGAGAVDDEPGDLLLAADVARLGGHPEKAIAQLERVVSAHSGDSRAPLAAFTLGRTLLDQLGRPREAAQAFASARRLAPRGALSQDALAREVESWSRAGEASAARERAEEYVTKYPKGRRLAAVRRLGGLD